MSVRRSVVWGFAGQVVIALTSFVGSAIVARLVSPREVGVYAAGMATMALITIVTSLGANAYVVRQPDLTERELATAFTINFALNAILSLLTLAVSAGAANLLGDPGVARVLQLLALVPVVQSLEFRPAAMLTRELRFQGIAIVNIIAALLAMIVTVTAAWFGQSYMSLAFGVLAGATVNATGLSVVGRRHVGFALTLEGARPIIVFGLRMMSIGGVAAIAQRVSEIILGRILGLATLGLYARASNLANLLFSNVYGTATRIAFAKLSQDQRETGTIKASFTSAFEMITGVMWPIIIGLAVLARPFIYNIYGASWLGAAPILSVLMIGLFIALCFGMNWELFVLADETARQTRYEFIRAVFGTVFFVGGATVSVLGAAWGRVGEGVLGLMLYLPHMRRLAGLEGREIAIIYARGAAVTALAVIPSLILMIWSDWSAHIPLGALVIVIIIGVVLWAGGLKVFAHPLAAEIERTARQFLRRRIV